jgi:hypothetical protein
MNTMNKKTDTLAKFGKDLISVLTRVFSLVNRDIPLSGYSTLNILRDFRFVMFVMMSSIL